MQCLNTADLRQAIPELRCGDRVLLSGTVYTARDAAHKRMTLLHKQGKPLPFDVDGSVIYYCGPTPSPPGRAIGSAGPTTSKRMDVYTPLMLELGLCAMIGKGERSPEVCEAIKRSHAVYFCAIGGAGALASKCITGCEVIAFEDLGCESVKKLTLKDLPLTVAVDSAGNSIFSRQ